MKIHIKQKFPCGYELEWNISGLGLREIDGLPELGNCPLHGKVCVKQSISAQEKEE